MINDRLKNKSKEELIQIIEKMIENNPNNEILLAHLLSGSKPNLSKTLKQIEKELKSSFINFSIFFRGHRLAFLIIIRI